MEIGKLDESLVTFFDFRQRHIGQPLDAEILYRKRGDHRTVHDGAAQTALALIPRAGELPEKAAGKRIARAALRILS